MNKSNTKSPPGKIWRRGNLTIVGVGCLSRLRYPASPSHPNGLEAAYGCTADDRVSTLCGAGLTGARLICRGAGGKYQQQIMCALSILLLVLLLVGWHIVCESVRELAARRSLETFAGAKLPDNAKLFYREDSWNGFLPDGHSVRGYAIGRDAEWINEKRCDRNGFSKVKRIGVTIPIPEEYTTIDNNLPVCHKYRVTNDGQNTEIAFIRGGLVIHYLERI